MRAIGPAFVVELSPAFNPLLRTGHPTSSRFAWSALRKPARIQADRADDHDKYRQPLHDVGFSYLLPVPTSRRRTKMV